MQNKVYSDHILIYKPSENSFFSIFERLSGVTLSLFGLIIFSSNLLNYFYFNVLLFFILVLFFFHFLNGLRIHLNELQVASTQYVTYSFFLQSHIVYSFFILYFSLFLSLFFYFVFFISLI